MDRSSIDHHARCHHRPRQLCRGREHRELPIQADFVGKVVPTKQAEIIKVMLKEFDEVEAVGIFERPTD